MSDNQKQLKPQNQCEGKRKDHGFGNERVSYMNKLPNEVLQLSSGTISHQVFPSVRMQQQQHALGSDHCNYSENHCSYMHSDNSPLSDLTSVNPTSSAVKSETNDLTSSSPRDTNATVNTALDDPGSIAKEAQYSGAKSENRSDNGDSCFFIPSELGSSYVQESSSMSSGTGDISLEAASFCQLQFVMEQV